MAPQAGGLVHAWRRVVERAVVEDARVEDAQLAWVTTCMHREARAPLVKLDTTCDISSLNLSTVPASFREEAGQSREIDSDTKTHDFILTRGSSI